MCNTKIEMGDIKHTQGDLPSNIVHTTATNCEGDDCETSTVTAPAPPTHEALTQRLSKLERLVHEKEESDRENNTLISISRAATKAIKKYHATLIRSAAQEIRERTSPEQMVLVNISDLLVKLTENKTMPMPTTKVCCEEKIAECMACEEELDVQTFCKMNKHQGTVEGCNEDAPIDLTKLELPSVDVEEEEPKTLEERVGDMEQWMTQKLHKRMDFVEANKKLKNGKLSKEEMKEKIKILSSEIKKELVKKMSTMERKRRKELMTKVTKLQKTIDNGGQEEEKDKKKEKEDEEVKKDDADDTGSNGTPTTPLPANDVAGTSDEEVLDADNNKKTYTLTGEEGEEDGEDGDDDEESSPECDDGGSGTSASLLELLPPCKDEQAEEIKRKKNMFHKVKEVETGSIDAAEIVSIDLDDPPPKTLPLSGVPLDKIIEGSAAPKNEEESAGLAEVGLTDR